MKSEDYTELVNAAIAQIHELSSGLSNLLAKDNKMRAAGGKGKFSQRDLANINSLLSVPLKEQISGNANGGDHE